MPSDRRDRSGIPPGFPVWIGWDPREAIAYSVARQSLLRHASIALDVKPIKQEPLRAAGVYVRGVDPLATTEFTYTRFLTPYLNRFEGWALFCDCDFLFLGDIAELQRFADPTIAVYCVQHDYKPQEDVKMDGRAQTVYPRKNWSSFMLFNCAHPSTRRLTPDVVNRETGAYLHRMQWAKDSEIGALPSDWNWLEGWSDLPASGRPRAVHYTSGGPWFETHRNVAFADLWRAEASALASEWGGA